MPKLTLTDLASLVGGSAVTTLNNNFALIETALENTLSRDGTSPNTMSASLDMNSNRIQNLVEAVGDTEPVRKAEFDEELEALETTVSAIASTAQGYANAAAAALDEFTDKYLGAKASDPSTDNDGNALSTGALYFNTTSNIMKVYDGSAWQTAVQVPTGSSIDDFSDVTITAAATGDVLRFNGTAWVDYPDSNYQPADADLTALAAGTLQNVSVLDATTEATIEAAIDTLANLTSIQGRTVTLADAGADAFFGWDDSESAYENLTAAEALAIIKTVDGSGSGLDADTLDGLDSTAFQPIDADLTALASGTLQNVSSIDATTESTIEAAIDTLANLTSIQGRTITLADAGANAFFGWDDTAGAYENLTASEALAIILTVDGSGSGLDADLVDGQHAAAFALLGSANTFTADGNIFRLSDNGATVGPTLTLDRLSTSPGNTDLIGAINFDGRDDGGNSVTYAQIMGRILEVANGAEDGRLRFLTMVDGTLGSRVFIDRGLATVNMNDMGGDTINAADYYDNNVNINTIYEGIGKRTGVNTQTASYTLVLADAGKIVEMNSASDTVVTVPTNASVAYPTGTWIDIVRYGSGEVDIAGDTGVTVRSADGNLSINSQYAGATLYKRGTNEWVLLGYLKA